MDNQGNGTSQEGVSQSVSSIIDTFWNEIMDEIDDFGISGTGYTVGHVPYNFRFVDYNSPEMEHYSLYDFKGKYVIIEVGALWCDACDTTKEILNDFEQNYDDFVVISLIRSVESSFISAGTKDLCKILLI